MATETLFVPEERLTEVIAVIRAGLEATASDLAVSGATREGLEQWCIDEEDYLARLQEDR